MAVGVVGEPVGVGALADADHGRPALATTASRSSRVVSLRFAPRPPRPPPSHRSPRERRVVGRVVAGLVRAAQLVGHEGLGRLHGDERGAVERAADHAVVAHQLQRVGDGEAGDRADDPRAPRRARPPRRGTTEATRAAWRRRGPRRPRRVGRSRRVRPAPTRTAWRHRPRPRRHRGAGRGRRRGRRARRPRPPTVPPRRRERRGAACDVDELLAVTEPLPPSRRDDDRGDAHG